MTACRFLRKPLVQLLIFGIVTGPLFAANDLAPLLEIKTTGTTEKDFLREEYNWSRNKLLSSRAKAWATKTWGSEAKKFCEDAFLALATDGIKGRAITSYSAAGDKLMKAGCDDPLVCYLSYKAHDNWRDGEAALNKALERMTDPGVSGSLMALIASAKVQLDKSLGFTSPKAANKAIEGLKLSLTDGSYDAASLHVMLRHHLRSMGSAAQKADLKTDEDLLDALKKSSLPEWVKLTLCGDMDVHLAWQARGNGWANTVTQNGWEEFGKKLTSARGELEQAWQANPASPEAAGRMITVAMGLSSGQEELVKWFDRATTAELDYPLAYSSLLNALLLKWGGSPDAQLRIGLACARTKRFDTEVPAILWEACEALSLEIAEPRRLYEMEGLRAALKEVQEGYLAEKDNEVALKRHAGKAAVAASLMGDFALAEKALAVAGPSLDSSASKYLCSAFDNESRLRLETMIGNGKFGPEVAALVENANRNNPSKLKEALAAIPPKALVPEIAGYVEDLRALQNFSDDFKKGDWVSLPFHHGLALFAQTGGRCSVEAKGGLLIEGADEQTWTNILFRLPVMDDCEIKGKVEIMVPPNTKIRKMTLLGPIVGYKPSPVSEEPETATRGIVLFTTVPDAKVPGQLTGPRLFNRNDRTTVALANNNTFHLGVLGGHATLDFNGNPAVANDDLSLTAGAGRSGLAGFCVTNLPLGAKLIVRDLQIRRSTAAALEVSK